jgi:YaiO family outer membrane protein
MRNYAEVPLRTPACGRSGKPCRGKRLSLLATLLFCATALANNSVCDPAAPPAQSADDSDPRQTWLRARAYAQDGAYDAAIREYRQLAAEYPHDVDYTFGEAQVRFWAGQNDCALHLASRARALAPDYEDIWKLEYQVLQAMHTAPEGNARVDAMRVDSFRKAAGARFPGALWMRDGAAGESAAWRWETGINRESLDNGAADWQNLYAYVDRRSADDSLVSLTLTEHRRFSLADTEVAIGGAFKPSQTWLLDGALRFTPGADFLPELVLDAGASRQLGNGWLAGADLRYRSYPDESVSTFGLNVERYFGNFRAAYHIDNTRLSTASSFTHRGVLNYYAESGSRYGLTIAAGDEVEIVAPGQLLEMDISAVALTGRHPLGERLGILWRIGTHRQGSIYRRTNLGLSIAGEF